MPNKTATAVSSFTLCAILALAGCGGGGGDSATASGSSSAGALVITPANADDVSSEVMTASNDTIGVGDAGSSVVTGVVVSNPDDGADVLNIARTQIEWLRQLQPQLFSSQMTGVVTTNTVSCTPSGTADVEWNDADNDGSFSGGDSLSVYFNNCVIEGATYNGTFNTTINSLTGDPSIVAPWSLGATLSFNQMSFVEGGESGSINGDFTFSINSSNGIQLAVSVTVDSLTATYNGDQTTLSSLNIQYTEQSAGGSFSLTMSGTLQSDALNGIVSFGTIQAFTGTDIVNSWPTSGRLEITGADNASVLLIALGGDYVELQVDEDGDAILEATVSTTWTELASL